MFLNYTARLLHYMTSFTQEPSVIVWAVCSLCGDDGQRKDDRQVCFTLCSMLSVHFIRLYEAFTMCDHYLQLQRVDRGALLCAILRFCNASVSCHGALLPWLFFDSKNGCRSARPLPAAAWVGGWRAHVKAPLPLLHPGDLGDACAMYVSQGGPHSRCPFGRRGPEGGGEVGGEDCST